MPHDNTFWQQHRTKIVPLLFWVIIIAIYYGYTRQNNLTLADSITRFTDLLTHSLYGPLFYIVLYVLRPILFFPATILTLLGGFFFGAIGIIYTVVGSNGSAMVAYAIGRYFGAGVLENDDNKGLLQQYTQRLRNNSFETVLVMRLLFLPYDLVNYASGFLKINWQAFLAATAIGSIPGTVSIVLLGTSFGTLEALLAGKITFNPVTLLISVLFVGISIALSRYIKRRETSTN